MAGKKTKKTTKPAAADVAPVKNDNTDLDITDVDKQVTGLEPGTEIKPHAAPAEVVAKPEVKDDAGKADIEVDMADESQAAEVEDRTKTEDKVEQLAKPAAIETGDKPNVIKRFGHWYVTHKKLSLPLTLLAVIGLVLAVPASRYPVLALWLKQDTTVFVVDESTKKPVASAKVIVDGQTGETNNNGSVTLKVRVGKRPIEVSKNYYNAAKSSVFVNAFQQPSEPVTVNLKATGRQVPIRVYNKVTNKLIENALVKAAGTEVKTDKKGEAILVLPAGKPKLPVEVSADGFEGFKGEVSITESVVPENGFMLSPKGKLYFLSKKSGKIDLVKTNLDGSDRQTVIAGTGKEEEGGTILLASRDWHYLALLSRRDSQFAKLYLIDTTSDKMTVMDEGNANFTLTGWNDDTFVYRVNRNDYKVWQPGRIALKAFDANSKKISLLDQTFAYGDSASNFAGQELGSTYLVNNQAIYTVIFGGGSGPNYYAANFKSSAIRSVGLNGQNRKDLKVFAADNFGYIEAKLYEPREVYFAAYNQKTDKHEYYEYESGVIKSANADENSFNKPYPTFLLSPSGKRVLWSETRDGKTAFFTGNQDAKDSKDLATLDEYQAYGWYSDDYVLVSKKGSELYIMSADGGGTPFKVTDYHKPNYSFRGYGGGYGGL